MLIFLPVSVLSLLLSLSFLVTVQVQAACQGDGGIISTIAVEDQVISLASLASGDIAAGYKNGKVKLFDQDTGDLIRDLPSHDPSKPVWGIAIIPFNGHIATVGDDKKILISDPMTGNLTTTITSKYLVSLNRWWLRRYRWSPFPQTLLALTTVLSSLCRQLLPLLHQS